jgi:thiamine-monophosphate kinase
MLDLPAQGLGVEPIGWVLQGGEDHSLLATFPASATLPRSFKVIGKVISKTDQDVLLDGQPIADTGWDSITGR